MITCRSSRHGRVASSAIARSPGISAVDRSVARVLHDPFSSRWCFLLLSVVRSGPTARSLSSALSDSRPSLFRMSVPSGLPGLLDSHDALHEGYRVIRLLQLLQQLWIDLPSLELLRLSCVMRTAKRRTFDTGEVQVCVHAEIGRWAARSAPSLRSRPRWHSLTVESPLEVQYLQVPGPLAVLALYLSFTLRHLCRAHITFVHNIALRCCGHVNAMFVIFLPSTVRWQ